MRPLFAIAAAFNVLVGTPMIVAPLLVYRLAGMVPPASFLEARMVGVFIVLFGALYWVIGRRDGGDRPLLGIGAAGKAGAFAMTVGHWLAGQTPVALALLGCCDLIFGLLFLRELLHNGQQRVEAR